MKPNQLTEGEFIPYYKKYIDLVSNVHLLEAMATGLTDTLDFFENIPSDKLNFRYAKGKWTPKDILLHLIDTERVFCYRAMCFARDKNANLPGFDENLFAQNAAANSRNLNDLLNEYVLVRTATICLFKGFDAKMLLQIGKGNDSPMSVRSAGFIICGHEIHHCNFIKEHYLI
jgi:hypothetical protein